MNKPGKMAEKLDEFSVLFFHWKTFSSISGIVLNYFFTFIIMAAADNKSTDTNQSSEVLRRADFVKFSSSDSMPLLYFNVHTQRSWMNGKGAKKCLIDSLALFRQVIVQIYPLRLDINSPGSHIYICRYPMTWMKYNQKLFDFFTVAERERRREGKVFPFLGNFLHPSNFSQSLFSVCP